jgi:hypothetical protein
MGRNAMALHRHFDCLNYVSGLVRPTTPWRVLRIAQPRCGRPAVELEYTPGTMDGGA